jgi:CshA-type fibril repeat protein
MKRYILSMMFLGAMANAYAQDPQISAPNVIPAPAVNGGPISAQLNFQNASSLPINNPDPVNNMTVITISLNKIKPTLNGGIPVVTGAGAVFFNWTAECSGTCAPDGSSDATDIWTISGFQNQVIPGMPDPFTTIGGPIEIAGTVSAPSTVAQANAYNGSGYNSNITPGAGGDIDLSPGSNSISTYTNTVLPPVATDNTASTNHDTNITVDILANDTPGDAALVPSTVTLIDPITGNPTPTVSVPGEGTYTVNPDGTVTFDPEAGFSGTATPIKYTVTDANGAKSNEATITITVGTLPVTLVSFNAKKEGSVAQLNWATTEETNSDYFEIQHSVSGKNWANVGQVASNGESKTLKNYTFSHANPVNGENLYRLKMVDKDATFAYSSIQSLKFDGIATADISLYPNPVVDKVFIKDYSGVTGVSIFDVNGRAVYQGASPVQGEISVQNLRSGIYIVRVNRANGSASSHKIVVSK